MKYSKIIILTLISLSFSYSQLTYERGNPRGQYQDCPTLYEMIDGECVLMPEYDQDGNGIHDNDQEELWCPNPIQGMHCDCPDGYEEVGFGCNPSVVQDLDFDGVPDVVDNCLWVANPQQVDLDRDGIGDDCDRDVRAGSIGGYISYFDSDGLDRSLPNARVTLMKERDPMPIAEAQTDQSGQYRISPLPINEINTFDDLKIQIMQNDILPFTVNGTMMYEKFYELPINLRQFDDHGGVNPINFLIYPPGDVIGRILYSDRPSQEALHGGISVYASSFNLDGSLDQKTVFTENSGSFRLDKIRQVGSKLTIQCCWRQNEYGESVYVNRYNEKEIDVNIIGLGTVDVGTITLNRIVRTWETLTQEAQDQIFQNDFESGQGLLYKAIDEMKNDKDFIGSDLAILLNNLAVTYVLLDNNDDALKYFEEAVAILQKKNKKIDLLIENNLSKIYNIYKKTTHKEIFYINIFPSKQENSKSDDTQTHIADKPPLTIYSKSYTFEDKNKD